jgi:formamidopyrimidine-DNA glycosylase
MRAWIDVLEKPRCLCPQNPWLERVSHLFPAGTRFNAVTMPELPEVEIVMRGLRPVLEGRRIAGVTLRREGLRFPFPKDFAARLTGKRITGLRRRAKYILGAIEGGDSLLIHLGMTGRFTVVMPSGAARSLDQYNFEEPSADGGNGPHDHVIFSLDDGTRIIYTDHRRFGMMDLFSERDGHKLLADIGVEPFGNELSAAFLTQAFRGKQAPLKAALLDQSIVAGLGNIYVCEALHRAKLSPRRKAGTLTRGRQIDPRLETLVRHIRDVLIAAIDAGGSTLQDFAHTNGASGAYQQRFAVYDREGEACYVCGSKVKRMVQSGRSTFYCGVCQK